MLRKHYAGFAKHSSADGFRSKRREGIFSSDVLPVTALMVAMAVTHITHAMKSSSAGFNARSMTDAFHRARVALARTSGTLAMDVAFAMSGLSMSVVGVLRGLV